MTSRRQRGDVPPLDAAGLERLALAYVERFATSRARLAAYLARKVAQRGWSGETPADPDAVAARMQGLGYVDDAAIAGARARALARRGYGVRRVAQEMRALGIGAEDGAEALDGAEATAWSTALRYAERRRLGPFATRPSDEADRRRALAAMLRAGHSLSHARKIIAAAPGDLSDPDE